MNIRELLTHSVHQAMLKAGIPADCKANVALSKKAGFGDYQANGAMGAAKVMKTNPRELAQRIVDNIELDGIVDTIDIAGPGFINLHINKMTSSQLERLKI